MDDSVFNELPLLLTVPRAALLLGITRAATYRLVASGELPARRTSSPQTRRPRLHRHRSTPRAGRLVKGSVHRCGSKRYYKFRSPERDPPTANTRPPRSAVIPQRRTHGRRVGTLDDLIKLSQAQAANDLFLLLGTRNRAPIVLNANLRRGRFLRLFLRCHTHRALSSTLPRSPRGA